MWKIIAATIISGLLIFPKNLHAGREILMYPLTSPGSAGSGKGFLGNVKVLFQNLSNETQHITTTISEEKLDSQLCLNATGVAGIGNAWDQNNSALCWWKTVKAAARPSSEPSVRSVTVGPKASVVVVYSMACDWSKSVGLDNCEYGGTARVGRSLLGFVPADIDHSKGNYHFRITVNVDEDVGALIGTIYTSAWVDGGSGGSEFGLNFPLNGGRPF